MTVFTLTDYQQSLSQFSPLAAGGFSFDKTANINDERYPLVSIITVVYNAEKTLETTIQNIITQTYKPLEYIIIDGGSSDGTLAIIRQYEQYISYWRSEPDEGLYDAMNKGIALANGSLIGIINSGDYYTSDAITKVILYHIQFPNSILIGNCQVILSHSSQRWVIETGKISKLPLKMIPHASIFVPISAYQKLGLFDGSFKIAADYDFLCRCYCQAFSWVEIGEILTVVSPRGVSGNYYLTEWEYNQIRLRYQLMPKIVSLLLTLRSFLTITLHTILEYMGLWQWVEERRHGSIR